MANEKKNQEPEKTREIEIPQKGLKRVGFKFLLGAFCIGGAAFGVGYVFGARKNSGDTGSETESEDSDDDSDDDTSDD